MQQIFNTKNIKYGVVVLLLAVLFYIYKTFNPSVSSIFPRCPFLSLTGLQCPGCGSQRAVHHLLNLEIVPAIYQNALLVLSIPYIMLGAGFDMLQNPSDKALKWRKILFSTKAIYVVLTLIITFSIIRNLVVWL